MTPSCRPVTIDKISQGIFFNKEPSIKYVHQKMDLPYRIANVLYRWPLIDFIKIDIDNGDNLSKYRCCEKKQKVDTSLIVRVYFRNSFKYNLISQLSRSVYDLSEKPKCDDIRSVYVALYTRDITKITILT